MARMFDEFFQQANDLHEAGVPFVTAVVVRAEKPTSGKPGDRAIVTLDGTVFGWVGGSCARPTVVELAARALRDGESRLIRLSPEPGTKPVPDGIEEVEMTCFSGGTLDIFIEPHQPAPRLLVIGSMPVAQALVRLGKAMRYHVIAVDTTDGDDMSHADEVLRDLEEIPERVTPLTFAIIATHGEYDEPALKAVLGTRVPYVGLVASRKRGAAVVASLELDGIDETTRQRVRFPAGLDIQAIRGDEIAVSILAEIVQARRAIGNISWPAPGDSALAGGTADSDDASTAPQLVTLGTESALLGAANAAPAGATAIDPVCHMTVQIEGAQHTFEHEGETYYFCAGVCRTRFAKDPAKYLVTG